MCSQIAHILRGKHKVDYTPHVDNGDYVIVINAEKIRFTGKKMNQKIYSTYSGYPGGPKSATPKEVLAKTPTRVVEKLFAYAGTEHFHAAQKPEVFTVKS